MVGSNSYVYFLYSTEQRNLRSSIEASLGKKYIPGKVLCNGKWEEFTEKSIVNFNRFSDTRVVCEGNLNDIDYENARTKWGA